MKKISYLKATKNNLNDLFNLTVEFENYNKDNSTRPKEHFQKNWEKYFRDEILESLKDKSSYIFLAKNDIGYVGYIYSKYCKKCYTYKIEELFVKPSYRNLGIADNLIKMAVRIGKKLKMEIQVEVFDWNKKAYKYYLKKGFISDSLILKLPK